MTRTPTPEEIARKLTEQWLPSQGYKTLREAIASAIRSAVAGETELAADVRELVIAARIVAFEDQSPEALKRLDTASEAFAERVPWDDDPNDGAKEPR